MASAFAIRKNSPGSSLKDDIDIGSGMDDTQTTTRRTVRQSKITEAFPCRGTDAPSGRLRQGERKTLTESFP